MNICVYSEQKSPLSVWVLHTFPAAGFQVTPCSLDRVYGALCETGGGYLWFGESDRRECRRPANVLPVYTWTLLHNTRGMWRKQENWNITCLAAFCKHSIQTVGQSLCIGSYLTVYSIIVWEFIVVLGVCDSCHQSVLTLAKTLVIINHCY